jgi:hypothetical protein
MIFNEVKIKGAFRIILGKAEDQPSFLSGTWHFNALTDKKGAK